MAGGSAGPPGFAQVKPRLGSMGTILGHKPGMDTFPGTWEVPVPTFPMSPRPRPAQHLLVQQGMDTGGRAS